MPTHERRVACASPVAGGGARGGLPLGSPEEAQHWAIPAERNTLPSIPALFASLGGLHPSAPVTHRGNRNTIRKCPNSDPDPQVLVPTPTGKPIVYTSADSVFQVACHEETVPLETLYAWCRAARRELDRWRVARVIARPFVGKPGAYARTYNRKDFAIATPERTVLERIADAAVPVVGVGKIPDIFDRKGITEEVHTAGNADGLRQTERLLETLDHGLLFVNLVDFDMLYGHRNDAPGYGRALEELDRALPRLFDRLRPGDVFALTADHGCDPTTPSTDHSREYVPLLVHAPGKGGGALGVRGTFADLGAAVSEFFGVPPMSGRSFLKDLR